MGRITQYVVRFFRPSPRRQRWVFIVLVVLGMVGVAAHPGMVTIDRELGFAFFAVLAFFPRMLRRLEVWSQSHRLRGLLLSLAVFWCLGFGAISYLLPPVEAILIVVPLSVVATSVGYVVRRRRTAG